MVGLQYSPEDMTYLANLTGKIKAVINDCFALGKTADAFAIASGEFKEKVVITV
ncbi:MAG: hypothetical protein RH948_08415 [Cyclobacteriaceae bacterium]